MNRYTSENRSIPTIYLKSPVEEWSLVDFCCMNRYTRTQVLFSISAVLTFSIGCIEQFSDTSEIQVKQTGIEGLLIPDGFDFNMNENLDIDVGFQSSNGRIAEDEAIQFAIFGVDLAGEIHGLKIGHTTLSKGIVLQPSPSQFISSNYI